MLFDFQKILYDNSLQQGNDNTKDGGTKNSYPGKGLLLQQLKAEYPDVVVEGEQFVIKGNVYILRYRSNPRWEFGGIGVKGDYTVCAVIKQNDNSYALTVVSSQYLKEKGKDITQSWSLNKEDAFSSAKENADLESINKEILAIVKGKTI